MAICDGIAMNHDGMRYSLASREIIADTVESMAMAHALDGLVPPSQPRNRWFRDAHGSCKT